MSHTVCTRKLTFEDHKVIDKIGLEYLSSSSIFFFQILILGIWGGVIPFFDFQGITLYIVNISAEFGIF